MSKGIDALLAIRNKIPEGRSVTLVGGAFDLLHPGHLHVIAYAKSLGDILVVSVLSDEHVKSYKGDKRPILPEQYRLSMVQALKSVDYAFISDGSSYSHENLEVLRPDALVFGIENDDQRTRKVEEQKARIRSNFPRMSFHDYPRFDDDSISTSALVEKIRRL